MKDTNLVKMSDYIDVTGRETYDWYKHQFDTTSEGDKILSLAWGDNSNHHASELCWISKLGNFETKDRYYCEVCDKDNFRDIKEFKYFKNARPVQKWEIEKRAKEHRLNKILENIGSNLSSFDIDNIFTMVTSIFSFILGVVIFILAGISASQFVTIIFFIIFLAINLAKCIKLMATS